MAAMIDDSFSRAHGRGSRPARSVGEGAGAEIREIFAGPGLAQADRLAAPGPAPVLDGALAHRVWVATAFLLGVIARDTLGAPGAARRVLRPVADADLTDGETRVLHYLPSNLSAREIARELYLSVNTIKTHQRHLYQKLGVASRSQAVERARALGLLAPSSLGRQQIGVAAGLLDMSRMRAQP